MDKRSYIFAPWMGINAAWDSVVAYNADTFNKGDFSQDGPNSPIIVMYTFPVKFNPYTTRPR
jgi:hypothetical protein